MISLAPLTNGVPVFVGMVTMMTISGVSTCPLLRLTLLGHTLKVVGIVSWDFSCYSVL